jgi:hypothetical protein
VTFDVLPKGRGKGLARCTLLGALLLMASGVLAGGKLPCRQAGVFSDAAVNVLVLPYRYSDRRTPPTEHTVGARLASLIQQEALFSMLKYESIGVTELVSDDGALCDVNDVIRMVTSPQNSRRAPVGSGLAIIWGRIYEDGDDIYVQSYVRFSVPGVANTITVRLRTESKPIEFEATLPMQGVALAPRRMTNADLQEIEARASQTLVLRDRPDENAPAHAYSHGAFEPLTYWVVATRGDWMKIRSQVTAQEGWVRARFDNELWSLRRFLPELAYLDGVVAYLQLQAQVQIQPRDPSRIRTWMNSAFAQYEDEVGVDAAREAIALSRAMLGQAVWSQPGDLSRRDDARLAAKLFRDAQVLIPESSEARNLAAVTSPLLRTEYGLTRESIAEIDTGLLGAIAMDGRNLRALRNLKNLYRYVITQPELSTYASPELEQRLLLLDEAQAAAASTR